MDKLERWQLFLLRQETTAANLVVLAAVAVFAWWYCIRGKRHEQVINWFAILTFWAGCIAMGVMNW